MSRKYLSIVVSCAMVVWAGSALADGDYASLGENSAADNVNVGSGTQTNAEDWEGMFDVNLEGNQLTGGGFNNNGSDRESQDVVIMAGDAAEVTNYALEASVSENGVSVAGDHGYADSSLDFADSSGYTNNYGVTAVSLNAGAAASQSVSVNVNAAIDLSQM